MDRYGEVWEQLKNSERKTLDVLLPDVESEIAYFKTRIIIRRRKDKLVRMDMDNNYRLDFKVLPRPNPAKPQVILRIKLKITPAVHKGTIV